MKLLNSLKNVTPLTGCTLFNIEIALKKEEYVSQLLLNIVQDSLSNPVSVLGISFKTAATQTLINSLFLMFNYGVFIDYGDRKIVVENSDSKEFFVTAFTLKSINLHTNDLVESICGSSNYRYDLFSNEIKRNLELIQYETDYIAIWYSLVDFSKGYFDNI